jgi:hypothetical protein
MFASFNSIDLKLVLDSVSIIQNSLEKRVYLLIMFKALLQSELNFIVSKKFEILKGVDIADDVFESFLVLMFQDLPNQRWTISGITYHITKYI